MKNESEQAEMKAMQGIEEKTGGMEMGAQSVRDCKGASLMGGAFSAILLKDLPGVAAWGDAWRPAKNGGGPEVARFAWKTLISNGWNT